MSTAAQQQARSLRSISPRIKKPLQDSQKVDLLPPGRSARSMQHPAVASQSPSRGHDPPTELCDSAFSRVYPKYSMNTYDT